MVCDVRASDTYFLLNLIIDVSECSSSGTVEVYLELHSKKLYFGGKITSHLGVHIFFFQVIGAIWNVTGIEGKQRQKRTHPTWGCHDSLFLWYHRCFTWMTTHISSYFSRRQSRQKFCQCMYGVGASKIKFGEYRGNAIREFLLLPCEFREYLYEN